MTHRNIETKWHDKTLWCTAIGHAWLTGRVCGGGGIHLEFLKNSDCYALYRAKRISSWLSRNFTSARPCHGRQQLNREYAFFAELECAKIPQHTLTTATHCNTLQHTLPEAGGCTLIESRAFLRSWDLRRYHSIPQPLKHTATHCTTLQHTASHCNTPYLSRLAAP